MIYFVNYMSSLDRIKNGIYQDIIHSYIESIDIEYKEFFINVKIIGCKDSCQVVPAVLKDSNKNIIAKLQFDFVNDNTFVDGDISLEEVLDIFSKSKTTISKVIPNNFKDYYKLILPRGEEEDLDILPDTYDIIMAEYKKVSKLDNFILFVERTLLPQDIEKIKNIVNCKVEILNLIRNPIIDYMLNSNYLDEFDTYNSIKYLDSGNINIMNLALIYDQILPDITTTIRYEDYLILSEIKLKALTIRSSYVSQHNSYISVVEAMKNYNTDINRLKILEIPKLTNFLLSPISTEYDNLPTKYTKNSTIKQYLEEYKSNIIIDCIMYEDDLGLLSKEERLEHFKVSVELCSKYLELLPKLKLVDKNFFKYFKYPIKLNLSNILYNK